MKLTIKDVATKANVSIATVSRILNNSPVGYSKKTKEKVLRAINELGYHPNAVARGLVNKRTQTIGVLFPSVSSMYSSEILSGIEDFANANNHSVIVCNTDSNGRRTMKYLQLLGEKRVDGIIFTSEIITEEYFEALQSMGIPTVLISTVSRRFPLPYVKVDDQQAAYTATQYLIQNGHEKIAMISGPPEDSIAGMPRVRGYMQALEDNGLPVEQGRIIFARDFGYQEGMRCMQELMTKQVDMTAIFAASDDMAIGVLSKAYKLGIKVPEQLSVIGYDDTKIAEMAIPPLTTVAQPLYEMGEAAMKMLFKVFKSGNSDKVESRIMPHKIVERSSVKAIN